jgi:hypothetical protein
MLNVHLNLEVYKAKDCSFLSVLDTSFYPVPPTSAELNVTVPGYSTPHNFVFVLGEINILNSYTFGFTTSQTQDFTELPDGLYTLILRTCPDLGENKRYHLRTCKIDCRLAAQWVKYLDCCDDEKMLYYLDRIDFLLRGAEAQADLCNPKKATELYIKADDLLRRIELDC